MPAPEPLAAQVTCRAGDLSAQLRYLYAVVYAAVKGSLTQGFQPSIFGTAGSVIGTKINDQITRSRQVVLIHQILAVPDVPLFR